MKFFQTYFNPPTSCGNRINNFNLLRFMAAAFVLYGHMGTIMGVAVPQFMNQGVHVIGVKILFAISGFLITKSFLKDDHFGRYLLRRSFRIFPGLIGVTAASVFVLGTVMTSLTPFEYFTDPGTLAYFKNVLLSPVYSLPGVFGNYSPVAGTVNGALWSLPVEFAAYFLLPLAVVMFRKLKCLKVGIGLTAFVCIAVDLAQMSLFPTARLVFWGTDWCQALCLYPFFFVGALWSFPEMQKLLNVQAATVLLILVSVVQLDYRIAEGVLAVVLPYFVFSFSLCERPFFGNWFAKADFSYGLYLYAFPVQQVVHHQLAKWGEFSLNVTALISLAVALLCAVGSWYLVEKPAQTWGRKLLERLTPVKPET